MSMNQVKVAPRPESKGKAEQAQQGLKLGTRRHQRRPLHRSPLVLEEQPMVRVPLLLLLRPWTLIDLDHLH